VRKTTRSPMEAAVDNPGIIEETDSPHCERG
jgi:hypothetical protein